MDIEEELLGPANVLGISVEIHESFALSVLALQPETRNEVLICFSVELSSKKVSLVFLVLRICVLSLHMYRLLASEGRLPERRS